MRRILGVYVLAGLLTCLLVVSGCSMARMGAGGSASAAESRGVWLTREQILEPKDALLGRLDRLRDAGFNTVYVITQLRGYVVYPESDVIPQWPEIEKHDVDLLKWLVPAIHERGMRAEAWTEYGFYGYWTKDASKDSSRGPILDTYPELTALDAEGRAFLHNPDLGDFYALCPANPKSHEVLIQLYLETLERYPFDGVSLDRVRYASGDFCYCAYCRGAFAKDTGITLARFGAGTKEAQALDTWRKERTREFVRNLAGAVRAKFPGRTITAAVLPPYMIDDKGQYWPAWLEDGSLDAALPMLYEKEIDGMVSWIRERVPAGSRVFYGLDASKGEETVVGQIEALRKIDAPGITLWEAGAADGLLPVLKEKVFMDAAESPLGPPRK